MHNPLALKHLRTKTILVNAKIPDLNLQGIEEELGSRSCQKIRQPTNDKKYNNNNP